MNTGSLSKQLLLAFVISVASAPLLRADQPASAERQAPHPLAVIIDRHMANAWKVENVAPAGHSSDAEFLRRVSLDIAGCIPSVTEARRFLDDASPRKREALVKRLLGGSGYVVHFSNTWRRVLLPEAGSDFNTRFLTPGFEAWLRKQLSENVAYDDLVKELLTAPTAQNVAVSPSAFYQAKEIKPENLGAATSRMFLGIRLECAQCHDHPFDHWQQDQFWEFATFFAGMQRDTRRQNGVLGRLQELFNRRTLTIPDTEKVVNATYLTGETPNIPFGESARNTLAEWITAEDNPYFARCAVNRMWGHFFGRGIVEPVDDFTGSNPPAHPELLDEMAREFVKHQFDLKWLIEGITASRAYQLTSAHAGGDYGPPELFARMQVKGLAPEQTFDTIAMAIGHREPFNPRERFDIRVNSAKTQFLERFAEDNNSPIERQTTILQALAMMNGKFLSDATHLKNSRTLAAVADFPLFTPREQVETLFLATLTRRPHERELKQFLGYIESQKARGKEPLADVFWVLLNSSEFLFNH